jgi:hypothetical protein
MPPVPNFDIPPSPPGSPPPGSTAKFTHFLELKKQGVSFNDRLEQSSALRNPGLYEKLRKFAGISDQDQYLSALPDELRDAASFPVWAYKDELTKAQQAVNKKKQIDRSQNPGASIGFVRGTE